MLKRTLLLGITIFVASTLLTACAVDGEDVEDLGPVTDGKGDFPEIRDREVTLKKRYSTSNPSKKTYSVLADVDFRVELRYEGDTLTRITVTDDDTGERVVSEKTTQPTITVTVPSERRYKIRLENYGANELPSRFSVLVAGGGGVSQDIVNAAHRNLEWVSREIDYFHLQNYGLGGSTADQFLEAIDIEYEDEPEMYEARLESLASMIFFAAPDVLPPEGGKLTPFHGLDMDQFETLQQIEDDIFEALVAENGHSLVGVRPFSVCETKYLIEEYVRPRNAFPGFEAHRTAYTAAAASCPQADLDEWYNFRGLGHLRPSWVESNIQDRFLRRMVSKCAAPTAEWQAECQAWNADRLGYRHRQNRALASRLLFYDPATQEADLAETSSALVLLEDRNGDGVGEFFREGPAKLKSGEDIDLIIESTGEFTGSLKMRKANGTVSTVKPQDVVAGDAVHPDFDAQLLDSPDFGLLSMLPDPTGCTAESIEPESCPLLKRFYVMIDRHEDFYRTYSALSPDRSSISSQPSPLVACSITLRAAHHWDSAGIPSGGTAGFIFLMRIPFKQILAGSEKSVSTLSPGPDVLALQELYAGTESLDLSKVWIDIASLSNNLYSSEHEISKFGAVPAEQIEGILVVRKPTNMP